MVRSRSTVIAALMVHRGEADALLTGLIGRYHKKLRYITVDMIVSENGQGIGRNAAPARTSRTEAVCYQDSRW